MIKALQTVSILLLSYFLSSTNAAAQSCDITQSSSDTSFPMSGFTGQTFTACETAQLQSVTFYYTNSNTSRLPDGINFFVSEGNFFIDNNNLGFTELASVSLSTAELQSNFSAGATPVTIDLSDRNIMLTDGNTYGFVLENMGSNSTFLNLGNDVYAGGVFTRYNTNTGQLEGDLNDLRFDVSISNCVDPITSLSEDFEAIANTTPGVPACWGTNAGSISTNAAFGKDESQGLTYSVPNSPSVAYIVLPEISNISSKKISFELAAGVNGSGSLDAKVVLYQSESADPDDTSSNTPLDSINLTTSLGFRSLSFDMPTNADASTQGNYLKLGIITSSTRTNTYVAIDNVVLEESTYLSDLNVDFTGIADDSPLPAGWNGYSAAPWTSSRTVGVFAESLQTYTNENNEAIVVLPGIENLSEKVLSFTAAVEFSVDLSQLEVFVKSSQTSSVEGLTSIANYTFGSNTPETITINMPALGVSPEDGNYVAFKIRNRQDEINGNVQGFVRTRFDDLSTIDFVNTAPTDITLSTSEVDENQSFSASISTTDADVNDTHTYTISGADAAIFDLSDNTISSAASFDFETKASYEITITTNDGTDTFQKDFIISVNDVNEAPFDLFFTGLQTSQQISFKENNRIDGPISSIQTRDSDAGDSHTYSVSGPDAANFGIGGTQLIAKTVFDFESRTSYDVDITTTDAGGLSYTETFTVKITDGFDFGPNQEYAEFSFSDGSFLDDINNIQAFGVESDRVLLFPNPTTDRFNEEDQSMQFTTDRSLKVADPLSEMTSSTSINFWVYLNADITSGSQFLLYGSNPGSSAGYYLFINDQQKIQLQLRDFSGVVLDIEAASAISSARWYMVSTVVDFDAGNIKLYINENEAALGVPTGLVPPVEWFFGSLNGQSELLGKLDDLTFFDKALNPAEISDLYTPGNTPPTDIILSNSSSSIDENEPIGTLVGALTTVDVDPNDTYTYTLSGPDAGSFAIDGANLETAEVLDYETKFFDSESFYRITVTSTDQDGLNISKEFQIQLNPVNEFEPTELILSETSIDEDEPAGSIVARLSVTDGDLGEIYSYSVGGTDASSFSITNDRLIAEESFDFETKDTYEIQLTALADNGDVIAKTQEIAINFVFVPTSLCTDPIGTNNVSTNGAPVTTDGGNTYIVQQFNACATGVLRTVSFVVPEGSADPGNIVLNLTEVNSFPPMGAIGAQITYNANVGLNTVDVYDRGFTVTAGGRYGIGFQGNISLEATISSIGSNSLYRQPAGQNAQVVDRDLNFGYAVGSVPNQSPNNIFLSSENVNEGAAINTTVGVLTTSDPDDSRHTYSLSGSDAASFNIFENTGGGGGSADMFDAQNNNFLLRTSEVFDFDTKSSYDISITTTDDEGASFEKSFTITVNDVPENRAPTLINFSSTTIAENNVEGQRVLVFSTEDPDNGDTHLYSISGLDAASFTVGTGSEDFDELKAAEVFDFETKSSYSIEVTSTDAGGLSVTQSLTISILDEGQESNDPTDIILSSSTVWENQPIGTTVGTLTTIDPDEGDTHTYTLAGDQGNSFSLDGSSVLTAEIFDFSERTSYEIEVTADDNDGGAFTKSFIISVTEEGVLSATLNTSLKVFPNPATDFIYLSKITSQAELSIFDLGGKIVGTYFLKEDSARIDLSELESGSYILQLTQNQETQTTRLIMK